LVEMEMERRYLGILLAQFEEMMVGGKADTHEQARYDQYLIGMESLQLCSVHTHLTSRSSLSRTSALNEPLKYLYGPCEESSE
jgi:hypothetical protein